MFVEYDETTLRGLYEEHKRLPRKDRGKFVEAWAERMQTTRYTLYRRFKDYDNGRAVSRKTRSDKGKVRVHGDPAAFDRDIRVIAGFKHRMELDTEMALARASSEEMLSKTYSITTLNRHMAARGINTRGMNHLPTAFEVVSPYSNFVWYIDATVANRYYLKVDTRKIVYSDEFYWDTSHMEDRLVKNGLMKIWIYMVVELYSRVYFPVAFAGYHKGENSIDWSETLRSAMLPKLNVANPFQGVPEHIYSDPGSGLKNSTFSNITDYFLITHSMHKAGNPSAKGQVESRIGHFKRKYESMSRLDKFETIGELNDFYQRWAHYDCEKKGYYQKWLSGFSADHPLKTCTSADFAQALVLPKVVTARAHGNFTIKGTEYHIPHREARGSKVTVYLRYGNVVMAKMPDGTMVECRPGRGQTEFGQYKQYKHTEKDDARAETILEGKRIEKLLTKSAAYPDETNVSYLKPKNEPAKTKVGHLPADDYESAESAWLYIVAATGMLRQDIGKDLLDAISALFSWHLSDKNMIPGDAVIYAINIISQIKEADNGRVAQQR